MVVENGKLKRNNILAIGAHPDDIEFGCGGAIVKHLELGERVFILIMTNGERGNHSFNNQECLDALEKLGIKRSDIIFGNFPDGYLKYDHATVSFIENFINKFSIKRVYTHYPNDRHQDHFNCSKSVSAAARKTPELLLFQGPSTNDPFEPHYFIELSEENLQNKIEALNKYKTQIEKGILNLRLVEGLALIHGRRGDAKYAEAFALNHLFIKDKNV